jgi:cellulose 1,4-beta-cellobiosidase
MHRSGIPFVALLAALADAQWAGNNIAETHPPLSWKQCASDGQCDAVRGEVVLDSNWRWLHQVNSFRNCFTGQEWNDDVCSWQSPDSCQCALEGVDYANVNGITSSGNALTLRYATESQFGTARNSRVYLMETPDLYKTFTLADNEIAFDVDLSAVGCGLNSKLFFVAMDADGGKAAYPTNRAGAKYGTGYCDATCTQEQRYVAGKASHSSKAWLSLPELTCPAVLSPTMKVGSPRRLIPSVGSAVMARAAPRSMSGELTCRLGWLGNAKAFL